MIRRLAERTVLRPPLPLMPVLIPFSLLYRIIAASHRWIYRAGLKKAAALPRPVVSIGNLAAGGGGKTPLTMWLAERLRNRGTVPGVLTRGYGKSGDRVVIADPVHRWDHIGDEPALMTRKVKGLPVAVSKDRRQGGEEILKGQNVDLFIMDDGFGHHALLKDLEVVVIDDNRRFGNGRLLPAGILREPVKRLRDANAVVVTKAADVDSRFEEEIGRYTKAPVSWADYRPGRLVPVTGSGDSGSKIVSEGPFLAYCGIADPGSFMISLERAGVETVEILSFPDHHPYSPSDVTTITERAVRMGARGLVTTEKDGVRWPPVKSDLPCFVLTMEVVFLKGEESFVNAVNKVLKGPEISTG